MVGVGDELVEGVGGEPGTGGTVHRALVVQQVVLQTLQGLRVGHDYDGQSLSLYLEHHWLHPLDLLLHQLQDGPLLSKGVLVSVDLLGLLSPGVSQTLPLLHVEPHLPHLLHTPLLTAHLGQHVYEA